MAHWLYVVHLAQNEEIARYAVDRLLVQLICGDHQKVEFREESRKASACEIALDALKDRYRSEDVPITRHKIATRYPDRILTNLGGAHFTAPCGCRVWYDVPL
jgi:hypothetical protein